MAVWSKSRGWLVAAGLAGVLAVAVGVWWATRGGDPGPAPDEPAGPFRESAAAAGLTWRMQFLPGEQGETFKINLYDHGSGVAVGDYDGDGHEDLYFCNQLGPNALYRNRGDGKRWPCRGAAARKTVDASAGEAGVSPGCRIAATIAVTPTQQA